MRVKEKLERTYIIELSESEKSLLSELSRSAPIPCSIEIAEFYKNFND